MYHLVFFRDDHGNFFLVANPIVLKGEIDDSWKVFAQLSEKSPR